MLVYLNGLCNEEQLKQDLEDYIQCNTALAIILVEITNLRELWYLSGPHGAAQVQDEVIGFLNHYKYVTKKSPAGLYQIGGEYLALVTDCVYVLQFKQALDAFYDRRRANAENSGKSATTLKLKLKLFSLDKLDSPDLVMDYLRFILRTFGEKSFVLEDVTDETRRKVKMETVLKWDIQRAFMTRYSEPRSFPSFDIYYQPIYDLKEERFVSAEALIRLVGSDGTIQSPGDFLPFAEAEGMMEQITYLVVRKVLAFLSKNRNCRLIDTISINLPAEMLADRKLPENLENIGKNYKTPLSKLRFEILENSFPDNIDDAKKCMRALKDKLRTGFYLDDFGTGYSNLAFALDYDLDIVKIDMSLGRKIDGKNTDYESMLAKLADILHIKKDIKIVFEGIGKGEDYKIDFCRKNNIERVQGYYYSIPLPEDKFVEFLETHKDGFTPPEPVPRQDL